MMLAAIASGLAANASAQEYPTRPVRLVVSSPPGSGVDIVARIVAQRMSDALGSIIVVHPALPDLPTVVEAGVPGNVVTSWFGMAVPARTSQAIIGKLNAALNTAMRGPDMRERLASEGAEPAPGSAAEFGRLIARELVIWAKVVKLSIVNY